MMVLKQVSILGQSPTPPISEAELMLHKVDLLAAMLETTAILIVVELVTPGNRFAVDPLAVEAIVKSSISTKKSKK